MRPSIVILRGRKIVTRAGGGLRGLRPSGRISPDLIDTISIQSRLRTDRLESRAQAFGKSGRFGVPSNIPEASRACHLSGPWSYIVVPPEAIHRAYIPNRGMISLALARLVRWNDIR